MASTGMLRSFYDPALYTSHVPQRLLNWRPYSPSVVLTLIVFAICWTILVKTSPSGEGIAAMGVLQVTWIISLSELWAPNVSSLLRWGSCYAGQQTKDQTSRR